MTAKLTNCPDCQVAPGVLHHDGCDVARCGRTGFQRLQCDHDDCNTIWTGSWPGEAECIEFGWFSRWTQSRGWQECGPNDPNAGPDLNRLHKGEAVWSRVQQRFVLRAGQSA